MMLRLHKQHLVEGITMCQRRYEGRYRFEGRKRENRDGEILQRPRNLLGIMGALPDTGAMARLVLDPHFP